jgi:hypothetical protein
MLAGRILPSGSARASILASGRPAQAYSVCPPRIPLWQRPGTSSGSSIPMTCYSRMFYGGVQRLQPGLRLIAARTAGRVRRWDGVFRPAEARHRVRHRAASPRRALVSSARARNTAPASPQQSRPHGTDVAARSRFTGLTAPISLNCGRGVAIAAHQRITPGLGLASRHRGGCLVAPCGFRRRLPGPGCSDGRPAACPADPTTGRRLPSHGAPVL